MVGNYKVVTLCGSTRFKDQFMEIQQKLTLEGYIVISVAFYIRITGNDSCLHILTPHLNLNAVS